MTDDFFSSTEERAGAEPAVRYVAQMTSTFPPPTAARSNHPPHRSYRPNLMGSKVMPVKDREELSRRRAYRRQDIREVQIRGKNEAAAFVDVPAARPLETTQNTTALAPNAFALWSNARFAPMSFMKWSWNHLGPSRACRTDFFKREVRESRHADKTPASAAPLRGSLLCTDMCKAKRGRRRDENGDVDRRSENLRPRIGFIDPREALRQDPSVVEGASVFALSPFRRQAAGNIGEIGLRDDLLRGWLKVEKMMSSTRPSAEPVV